MNNIREIRKCLGLSQNQFAKLIGMSRARITDYEYGDKIPLKTAKKIASVLHIQYEYVTGQYRLNDMIKSILSKSVYTSDAYTSINEYEPFITALENLELNDVIRNYVIAMKMVLLKLDEMSIEQLEDIYSIVNKLNNAIGIRQCSSNNNNDMYRN